MDSHDLAREALEEALLIVKNEFLSLPDGEEVSSKVCAKLQRTFDKPPTKEFEVVLHKNFTDDEVRVALFRPRVEQMWYFSALLQTGLSVPEGHDFRKLSSLVLSLIFLIHRKNWDFLKEFVIASGLESLVKLIVDSNLYERSQAMEILLTITDCDLFDWFLPPPSHTTHSAHTVQLLHHALLSLSQLPHFLDNVIQNRAHSYPGGSFRALQFLAFWLSWVRALYTKDQRLTLSKKMLEEIRLWSLPDANKMEEEIEEERKLAATLLDDFGKESLISEEAQNEMVLSGIERPVGDAYSESASTSAMAMKQWEMSAVEKKLSEKISLTTVNEEKEEGNRLYKANQFAQAVQSYRRSLFMFSQLPPEEQSGEVELALRSNLANALWKLYSQRSKSTIVPQDEEGGVLLDDCEQQVQIVLEKEPLHVKGCYRLVCVLLAKKKHREAFERCSSIIENLKLEKKDVELFAGLKFRCVAGAILNSKEKELDPYEWGLSAQHISVLTSLLKRHQLQDKISLASLSIVEEDLPSAFPKFTLPKNVPIQGLDVQNLDEGLPKKVVAAKKEGKTIPKKKISSFTDETASDTNKIVKKKVSNEDRSKIQRLKVVTSQFSAAAAENKCELVSSSGEFKKYSDEATQIIIPFLTKKMGLKEIYPVVMEEDDVLLWLYLIANSNSETDALKMVDELSTYERINSALFMIKVDHPQLIASVSTILTNLDSQSGIGKGFKRAIRVILNALH